MSQIRVELFGIPRHRAGVAELNVCGETLGEVLSAVGISLPQLQEVCLSSSGLRRGYLANLNGRAFISDPATPMHPGDALLILSSDVGG